MIERDLVNTFGTADLYAILEVKKDCSPAEIKKAYHKKSLQLHPDRQQEDKENFTTKFQLIHQIYTLLSDSQKREEYDRCGTLNQDDFFSDKSADDWISFWRQLFKPITKEDVEDLEKKFKGSEEEREDVKKHYNSAKGDMDVIMDSIMMVRYDEEDRIRSIIDDLIEKKEVKAFKTYAKEDSKKRKRRLKRGKKEEEEAEEWQDQGQGSSLAQAIAVRQEEREKNMDSFFAQLEAKYAQPAKKRKINPKSKTSADAKTKKSKTGRRKT